LLGVYQLHYHFVFSTKYRKPALKGSIGEKVRDLASPPSGLSSTAQGVLGSTSMARGYFVATTGNVTDEVIAKYIETQDVEHQNDDVFKVSG
jgi:REP element-mobilizing transposase RayT